jgi:hypothetical protein
MFTDPSSDEPQVPTGEPAQPSDAPMPMPNQWASPGYEAAPIPAPAPMPAPDPMSPPAVPTWGQAASPYGPPAPPGPPPGPQPGPPSGYPPYPGYQQNPGYQQCPQQYPGYGGPMYPAPPTPPKKSRAWVGWVSALVVVCLVLVFVYALQSHNKNAAPVSVGLGATPSGAVSEPAGAAATGQPGPGVCDPQDLTSCLLPTPADGEGFATGWGADHTPTVAQYAQQEFTAGVAEQNAVNNLNNAGVQALAHAAWYSTLDDNEMDIMLFRFGDVRGAESWALDREGTYMAANLGTPITVPGDSNAEGYSDTSADSSGFIDTQYAQAVGDIALIVRYSSKGQLSPPEFQEWASDQLTRLGTAPTPSPESSTASSMPSLPSFAPSAGCVGGSGPLSASAVDGCLMQLPSGTSADTATTYDTTENPSLAQYVAEFWSSESSDQQSYEVSLLQQYGAQNIAHRRWETGGDQINGDVVLISFSSKIQAEGQALNQAGLDMPGNESCDTPSLPDAYCNVHPKDSSNNVWTQIIAWRGSVELKFQLNSLNTANLATGLAWAQTELEQLGPVSS